jgi:hypothetical protein
MTHHRTRLIEPCGSSATAPTFPCSSIASPTYGLLAKIKIAALKFAIHVLENSTKSTSARSKLFISGDQNYKAVCRAIFWPRGFLLSNVVRIKAVTTCFDAGNVDVSIWMRCTSWEIDGRK